MKGTATCHVFGQTHCVSAKDVLNRDKDVRLIQSNQVKRGTLVKQCSKKNSDLSRLWTDTLCERKNSQGKMITVRLSRLWTDTLCGSKQPKRGEWRLRKVPVTSLDRHPGNKENQTLRSEARCQSQTIKQAKN